MSPGIRKSIRALHGYVPGEQPTRPVLKLNTNENPYPPSPAVMRALQEFDANTLRLYPEPRSAALREKLADTFGGAPENYLIGNGSDELLALCVRAFTERDECVGCFDPSYSLYSVLAAIEERGTALTPLGPDFEWQPPDPDTSALFFLTCPNAPTGIRYPRPVVTDFCESYPGIVALDEAYADFADETYLDLALRLPNTIALRTLSKSYSLAGLRIGFVAGPADLIAALDKIRDSYNVDRIAQTLALAALSDPDTLRRNVGAVRQTRAAAMESLTRLGFRTLPSEANFLWTRPPSPHTARDLFKQLRDRNIFVRHFPGPRTADWLRITVGTDEQMQTLFRALQELL